MSHGLAHGMENAEQLRLGDRRHPGHDEIHKATVGAVFEEHVHLHHSPSLVLHDATVVLYNVRVWGKGAKQVHLRAGNLNRVRCLANHLLEGYQVLPQ